LRNSGTIETMSRPSAGPGDHRLELHGESNDRVAFRHGEVNIVATDCDATYRVRQGATDDGLTGRKRGDGEGVAVGYGNYIAVD